MRPEQTGSGIEKTRVRNRFERKDGIRGETGCLKEGTKLRIFKFGFRPIRAPYQLNGCHMFFPPKVGLSHRAKGGQSVVQVHDNMYRGIYHGMERAHSS